MLYQRNRDKLDYFVQKTYTLPTQKQWKKYRMARFNKREFGGIYYKVRPVGFRNWLNLYKVFPCVLGYDIRVKLLIKRTERNRWWSGGTLDIMVDGKWERGEDGGGYFFAIGDADKKGQWSKTIRAAHPLYPCTISCYLNLAGIKEIGDYGLPVTGVSGAALFEDVRFISSHTAIAWGLTFIMGIALLAVGIWNAILILN